MNIIDEVDIHKTSIPPPIDPNYIEHWVVASQQSARLRTQNDGRHPPTVLYLADDPLDPGGLIEGRIDVSPFFINQEGKQRFAQLAPALFTQLKAFAILSVFESYVLLGPEKLAEYNKGGYTSMGEVPGSKEVLMISIQTRAKVGVFLHEIVRDANDVIVEVRKESLSEHTESEAAASGAMVGWVGGDDNEVN